MTTDYKSSVFLPKTDFPMRAGLPRKEPELLKRWADMRLFERLRAESKGRPKFVLHDGPPYANGNIHLGTALNKILKDMVTRSQQLLGFDSNYVPGWDCHGLPIEWKIEEEYRAKGQDKDAVPVNEFRKQCRDFAQHWIGVQREEFMRLGVEGDWQHYYSTMDYRAEATIAAELMKFAMNGTLYRGSKPVMWSVVEKTALAEAEVEYHDYQSDTIYVKFPIEGGAGGDPPGAEALAGASIVVWTTTPWTIPGNRAISYSGKVAYGLYRVTASPAGNWAGSGERYVLADKLAERTMKAAKVESFVRVRSVAAVELAPLVCAHPLRALGYAFQVPLFEGDHVTDQEGTGFVHTAPGHGREDFITGQKYGLLDADGKATEKYFAMATEAVAQLARELAGQAPIAEVTFKDFSNLAKRRGHTPESLAPLFRGKIEEPREFFERVISCRRRGEDLSDTVIPYRSVIEFYRKETCSFMEMRPNQRTCACGCRQPVFDRKKWASPGCRQRFVRRKKAPDVHFASV